MTEQWLDVIGYEGIYKVSNYGNVCSLRCKKNLKPFIHLGYPTVAITKNKIKKECRVHRLVALAFLQNPENKKHINHIDGDKENSQLSNLEWVTPKENYHHSISKLGNKPLSGRGLSKRPVTGTNGITTIKLDYASQWRDKGYFDSCIIACCKGRIKTYKGMVWRYA